MMSHWRLKASLAACTLLVAGCSGGGGGDSGGMMTSQATPSQPSAADRMSAGLSEMDKTFITDAAQGGYAEVAAGQAATGSKNPRVRRFGLQMVKDHSAMNNELTLIATKKGITPPTDPGIANEAKGAVTNNLPGTTFDNQYVSQQITDHQTTLQLLQQEASSGKDPELRAFAKKYQPVVERHLAELQTLQARMVRTSS